MRKAIGLGLLLVGLLLATEAARADENSTTTFDCARDTWVSSDGGEQLMNGGWNVSGRAAKVDENWAFFDWNMPAIDAWIASNLIPADYYPVFTLSIMPASVDMAVPVNVSTLTSVNDWAEGDQTVQWTNMAWSSGTAAATYRYAQTYYTDADGIPGNGDEVLDTVNSVPWGTGTTGLANFAAITPAYTNSNTWYINPSDANTDVPLQLDYQIMNDMRTNPDNQGLYLRGLAGSNMTIYFDEDGNNAHNPPRLTVSFSNEPFPFLWVGNTEAWSTGTAWSPTGPPLAGFDVMFNNNAGTVTLDMDPTVRNWVVRGGESFIWTGGTVTLNGVLDFAPTIPSANDLYSRITGPGRVAVTGGRLDLINGANDYSGGTTIATGARIHIHGSGALGTGSVNVSGILYTNNANTLAGPLPETGDFAGVIIQENGKLWLNSVETAKVEILSLGALETTTVGAGSTFNYDYLSTGNIKMHKGAVVTANVPTLPTAGQLASGDGIFGIWLGDSNTDRLVGDGGGTVFRGLASTGGTLVYNATVTETTGGSLGPMFLATAGNTFAFDTATVVASGTNTMKLVGDGNFEIRGTANNLNCNIDTAAAGRTLISAADGITGKTLTATNGYVDMGDPNALRGATTIIGAGGAFQPTFDPALPMGDIGTLTIKTGGALDPHSGRLADYAWDGGAHDDRLAGLTYTLEKNSQILLNWYNVMATTASGDLPGAGLSDYVHYFGRNVSENNIGENRMLLGDDTRLTTHWIGQKNNATWDPTLYAGTAGYIGLAADQTQARITNQSDNLGGGDFRIAAKVDLTCSGTATGFGKLIVGDPNDFNCFGRYQHGFDMITQDGRVQLTNAGNVIGSIDVQAGRLRADNTAVLGGAADINVAAGGEFYAGVSMTLAATFTGSGAVTAAAGQTLTLSGVGSGLSPGNSAGIMTVNGAVVLGTDATLQASVVGSGGVAGADFDQLDVQGALNVANGALLVSLPLPGPGLIPANLQAAGDMVIATANVTGTFASAGMGPVAGTNIDTDPLAPGIQLPNHWQPVSGMPLVEFVGGQVILKGANIEWRGMQGDATLDDICDLSDLVVLAGNYRQTSGKKWTDGDFNYDGAVDLSDLALLAGNYRMTNPNPPPGFGGDGTPVPEPACIGLLMIGLAGVLRRRHGSK